MMIKHIVAEKFDWYPDGFTRNALTPGDERDFGDMADGLLKSKLISAVVRREPAPVAESVAEPVAAPKAPYVEHAQEPAPEPAAEPADKESGQTQKRGRGRPKASE